MHEDLERAKEIMAIEGCTCVITYGEICFRSKDKGVRPLLDWLYSGNKYAGWRACDKVIGRAAAFLHILLGVREVYADVVSEPAVKLLEDHGITVNAGTVVPAILNEAKDGQCPLETAVEGLTDANDAVMAIELAIKRMSKK